MAEFTYKGIPIEENGVVVAVQPVKAIQADDGKYYRGVLDVDSRGNAFVYNQYPNTGVMPGARRVFVDVNGAVLLDNEGRVFLAR